MKTQLIGKSPLVSTRLVYGNMRVSGGWDPTKITPKQRAAGRDSILAAYEAGYRHFDTADIYCRGVCESILGDALAKSKTMRREVVITTKCGIRFGGDPQPASPHRYDFSSEHIVWSCEQSLKRMRIETIDLFLLHRPDFLMDPGEIAGAFARLRLQGKVREFGVSNFTPSRLAALARHLPMALTAHQVEIHPARLDAFFDGTLDQCLELGITPQAWSPVWRGVFAEAGTVPADHPRREDLTKVVAVLDELAKKHRVKREAITLAWLLKHPSHILPVVGSTKKDRILDSVKADTVDLSREEWYQIYVTAQGKKLP